MYHFSKSGISRRSIITAAAVLVIELLIFSKYAGLGAELHFWLHALSGAALGLALLTLWKLYGKPPAPAVSPWEAGVAGHIYSIIPDVLFILFGAQHMHWMDIFGLHISLHYVPYPVMASLVLFSLSLIAYRLAATGKAAWAARSLALTGLLLVLSLSLRGPVPLTPAELTDFEPGKPVLSPDIQH